MKVSLVWNTPNPERTISVAMRRCYSTKPIEEIQSELELKGPEYWKYLLTRALQDKSMDVLEHFCLTLRVDDVDEARAGRLVMGFPHIHLLNLGGGEWLVSMNARTLVELWRGREFKDLAETVVATLDSAGVCPIFNSIAFGERIHAN
jgi:hypothetical protein